MIQFLVYVISYPFLWIVSKLPDSIFYFISDVAFFLVYRLFGYRKKVVLENLQLVFPEKNMEELKGVRYRFYKHMCDMFLEMVKTMSLTKDSVKERYQVKNMELLQEIEKDKSILVVCAHYANWEWNVSMNNYVKSKGYAVYQPVANKYFDALVKRLRSRWNTTLITQKETIKTVVYNERNNIRSIFGMVSDQSPQHFRAPMWSEFMGITVPVFNGAELLARKLDLAVVFLKVNKTKRGHYSAEFIPITLAGKETEKNEITEKFLALTEAQIREQPDYYFWTHKRWKHRDKVPANYVRSTN